jgi:hypothetical protein
VPPACSTHARRGCNIAAQCLMAAGLGEGQATGVPGEVLNKLFFTTSTLRFSLTRQAHTAPNHRREGGRQRERRRWIYQSSQSVALGPCPAGGACPERACVRPGKRRPDQPGRRAGFPSRDSLRSSGTPGAITQRASRIASNFYLVTKAWPW